MRLTSSCACFVVLAALGGCPSDPPPEGCVVNADCTGGNVCVNGICAIPTDGGGLDVGLDADTCGQPCETELPCELAIIDCSSGVAICTPTGAAGSDVECRASRGECDSAEMCDGVDRNCPVDALMAAGTVCREAAGECDVAESCSGDSTACPLDVLEAAGTECGAGFCDGAGMCAGSCTEGAACSTGNPCELGMIRCAGDTPSCVAMAVMVDDSACGPSSAGPWGPCTFGSECADRGVQSQSVTNRVCQSGECVEETRDAERSCERRSRDGLACDGGSTAQCFRCAGGACAAFVSCAPPNQCCPETNTCSVCRRER